jgi:hypothetical protein
MTTGVFHHLVELRSSHSRPAKSVIYVLLHNLKPGLGSKLAKVKQLGLWVLVNGRDAAIECGSFHWLRSSFDIGGDQNLRDFVTLLRLILGVN